MENYVVLSLETHLFFARIMREHALFLEAGFPCQNREWIRRADWFRGQFEQLLHDALRLSSGRINRCVTESGELVTQFTKGAEQKTEQLSGIPIDSRLTVMAGKLSPLRGSEDFARLSSPVTRLNERALRLLDGLIGFKENILREVGSCNLFTANYPLLIEHILREARLYRSSVKELLQDRQPSYRGLRKTELFWNQIMMEHALFIRGLLDPSEEELIRSADHFAEDYRTLLADAVRQDIRAGELTKRSLDETRKYREFKSAGTEGILNCSIVSIILPLLADHVLREANHYIRLLECDLSC